MQRSILVCAALLLGSPAVQAAAPELRSTAVPHHELHERRMAGLAPSLRAWVIEEGKRRAGAEPDLEAIGAAVRARLSGQDYSAMDANALVQLVLAQCYRQTTEDLRAVAEEMKAANARRKAEREAAQAARDEKGKDSTAELGEEQQRRLQAQQERRSRILETLSNLMKQYSETESTVISNLK
jgi:hypothetical protein